MRAREMGFRFGSGRPGRLNAITDVDGVRVGHKTLVDGDSVRTGVTAVLPNAGDVYMDRVVGGAFVLNGAGELSGITQLLEWGLLESPILLTNTLSVGACGDALVRALSRTYPKLGREHDVVIPLVGECDDSWLNDAKGRWVQAEHVDEAIAAASSGAVVEGSVGGGTGMMTCDFKGGIGTSSRVLADDEGGYTVGVLVMSNFGHMEDLRVDGAPVGRWLAPDFAHLEHRRESYGSIIVVVATDAPLSSHQLNRLAKRAALGIGRAGSSAAHGSGEIVIAFSTANTVPRTRLERTYTVTLLADPFLNPLYARVAEATEEAIANALFAAEDMYGQKGRFAPALPQNALNVWAQEGAFGRFLRS